MSKYLDLEKLEYNDNIVEIDDDISETILVLNKKGYKTDACCSGHSKIDFYEYELPLDKKEDVLNGSEIIYEESDKLYCVMPSTNAYVYIKFDKHYDFKNIPEGFDIESNYTIGKNIYLWDFDEKCYIRPLSIIEEQIKEANKALLEWAKELEPLKKDN